MVESERKVEGSEDTQDKFSSTIVKVNVVKSSLWERRRLHIRDVAIPPSL